MKINITTLLDRSGSMDYKREDHIGGLRSFIKDQQNREGETKFTLIQFDGNQPFEVHIDNKVIENVKDEEVDLIPRGSTPLLDAVGKTLAFIEEKEKTNKSDQVILVILTDGGENTSKEWTKDQVKKALDKVKNDYIVMFLGEESSAWSEGGNFGLKPANIMPVNYNNSYAVDNIYAMSSNKINNTRGMMASGHYDKKAIISAASYTDEDRKTQEKCNSEA